MTPRTSPASPTESGPSDGSRSGVPAPLADRLKETTAADHAAAEGHAFQRSLVAGTVSRERFLIFQSRMLGLLRALRPHLEGDGPEWAEFREALGGHEARLAADLRALANGADPNRDSPERSPALREFGRLLDEGPQPEAALGAFYVIEGSMNGNRFMRRALAGGRPDLAGSLSYFDPYGDRQRERWRELREAISRAGERLGAAPAALSAGRATFGIIGRFGDEAAGAPAGPDSPA